MVLAVCRGYVLGENIQGMKGLEIAISEVSYAVQRGNNIAKEGGNQIET